MPDQIPRRADFVERECFLVHVRHLALVPQGSGELTQQDALADPANAGYRGNDWRVQETPKALKVVMAEELHIFRSYTNFAPTMAHSSSMFESMHAVPDGAGLPADPRRQYPDVFARQRFEGTVVEDRRGVVERDELAVWPIR